MLLCRDGSCLIGHCSPSQVSFDAPDGIQTIDCLGMLNWLITPSVLAFQNRQSSLLCCLTFVPNMPCVINFQVGIFMPVGGLPCWLPVSIPVMFSSSGVNLNPPVSLDLACPFFRTGMTISPMPNAWNIHILAGILAGIYELYSSMH